MPKVDEVMEAVRNLTAKRMNATAWTHEHDAAFMRIKERAITVQFLKYFTRRTQNPLQRTERSC